MIKTLELKNFRGIKEGKIELAPMTILIGPNNSGKTTILEALFLAPNPFREVPYQHPGITAVEVIYQLHQTLESKGYLFLLRNYASNEAEIKCDEKILHFIKQNGEILIATNQLLSDLPKVEEREGLRRVGSLPIYTNTPKPRYVYGLMKNTLLYSSNLRKMAFYYISGKWIQIANSGICRNIAGETSNLIYEDYIDITIEPFTGDPSINAYLKDGRRIRLGDLGEGVQDYMVARILCEYLKPSTLLWDDVESHMNPKMLLAMGEWFSRLVKGGTQIITTTHSLEAVRVIASMIKDARICLTKLEDGVLSVRMLTLEEVEGLQEAGMDVRSSVEVLI